MTALIIDDEPKCQISLQTLLSLKHPNIEITGKAGNIATATKLIEQQRPDILFLDIELEDGTGFDLLSRVNYHDFALIFITGFNHYARLAIEFEAMAYLDKPVDRTALAQAINRAQERLALRGIRQQLNDINLLIQNTQQRILPQRLAITNMLGIHYLLIDDIRYLAVKDGYTEFHQTEGPRVGVSSNLVEYERKLKDYPQFMRVHKSYLVNLKYVRSYYQSEAELEMIDGTRILVGKKHIDTLKKRLEGV